MTNAAKLASIKNRAVKQSVPDMDADAERVTISISMKRGTVNWLKACAAEEDRSFSRMAERFIVEGLKRRAEEL